MKKAQGTIEYLVIIAIVVVIALVVVSLLVGLLDQGSDVSEKSNKLANWTNTLAVTETSVTPDGNYLVRLANNSGEELTVTNVQVGDTSGSYSQDLFMSGAQNFVVDSSEDCDLGVSVTKQVTITYVSKYGLEKTEVFPVDTFFNCEDYTVSLLANQCVKGYVSLGSRQTSCWNGSSKTSCPVNGFPMQDGDAYASGISLVSNGDSTVSDSSGLMWQKGHKADLNWQEALQYCDNLSLEGYGNWRLPAFGEIWHTYDYENGHSADLVGGENAFEPWASGNYWTSTTYPLSGGNAYNMYAHTGFISYSSKSSGYFARCVRLEN